MRDDDYEDRLATPSEAVDEWRYNVATVDPEACRCAGGGWMLHDWDVWVKCPMHYAGQQHPESYDPDET